MQRVCMGPSSDLHPHFADLAESQSQDEQRQQQPDGSASMSVSLEQALGQIEKKIDVKRGTLADAWMPQLEHESDLSAVLDATLERRVEGVQQASSDDPNVILNNLASWRTKYLRAVKANEPRNVVQDYLTKAEAIRAKARLLFVAQKSEKWAAATKVRRHP